MSFGPGGTEARPGPITWVPDVAGAAIATGLAVYISSHLSPAGSERELDLVGFGLVVVGGGSLALSRRWPRVVLGAVVLVLAAYYGREYPNGPVYAAGWFALFMVSWRTDRRTALVGAGVLCGVLAGVSLAVEGPGSAVPLVFVAWSAVAALLGDALRNRHSVLDELRERARYLERTREEEARRRVAEDRLSIARDLHDSVAHAMATINVQAGAAAHVVDRRPEAAKEALSAIQRASGDVLDDLGAMMKLLRSDSDDVTVTGPMAGLDDLPDLVAATQADHLPVSLLIHGSAAGVPSPIAAAAYRIVQESLTNVVRHASASTATVTVTARGDRDLTVEVRDDGTAGSGGGDSPSSGLGIRGMRERAEATGGRLEAGRRADRGFVVRAVWGDRP